MRIQGASNLRQIGIALHEYANEYRGQYPLACISNFNFADASLGTPQQIFAPLAGLTPLFVDSYGHVDSTPIINPRSGVLPDTVAGISTLYSPDTNSGFTENAQFPPGSWVWNKQGLCVAWGQAYGLSYWVDEGLDYSPSYDLCAITTGNAAQMTSIMHAPLGNSTCGRYNPDPRHQPVLNPQSGPGTLLVTDNALFTDQTGSYGLNYPTLWGLPGVYSNYVDEGLGKALPAGEHEMYNDGSVRWVPMSNIKVHFSWNSTVYQGW